ncbi:DUF4232 domain-containing protein [Streptomyces sp. NPDC057694]|uniref:DUF4232 domain-containing protein n=1 Tax=Streptomyces sp. NPDC057694 TaxID=3346216 RepID=UPI0036BE4A72
MRTKKYSALALVVAAAGLSLTACGGADGSDAASGSGSTSTAASGSTDSKSSDATGSDSSGSDSTGSDSSGTKLSDRTGTKAQSAGSGSASTSASTCKTDHLTGTAAASGVKNEIVVSLKNTGSTTCTMHGFPGVQLIGPDGLGDTGPDAARTDAKAPTVTVGPGEENRFLLRWIPDSKGKKFTRLSVTPPNETVSEIVNLDGLDITVPADGGSSPDVFVDPVGYHVGSGK